MRLLRIESVLKQRVPIERISIRRPRTEAALATAYAIFYIAAALAVGLAIRRWPTPLFGAAHFTSDAWYVILFKLVLLLTVPLLAFWRLGYGLRDLLPDWRPTLWVPVAFLAGVSVNLMNLGTLRVALARAGAGSVVLAALLAFIFALATAGIPEELFFRGILQTRLEAVAGRLVSIVTTAVLFAAWHLPTRFLLSHGVEGRAGDFGSVIAGTGIPVLVVGLVFGFLWDRYRDLPVLIALHTGIDTLPALWSFLGIVH